MPRVADEAPRGTSPTSHHAEQLERMPSSEHALEKENAHCKPPYPKKERKTHHARHAVSGAESPRNSVRRCRVTGDRGGFRRRGR